MQRVRMAVRVRLHANGAGAEGNMCRRGTMIFWVCGRMGVCGVLYAQPPIV